MILSFLSELSIASLMISAAVTAPSSSVPTISSTNTFFCMPLAMQANLSYVTEVLPWKSSGSPFGLDTVRIKLPLPSLDTVVSKLKS